MVFTMALPAPAFTASEVQKNFGYYQDQAIKEPVFISKNGRTKTVLVSLDEFVRLKERDRQAYSIDNLPEEVATAILEATVSDDME